MRLLNTTWLAVCGCCVGLGLSQARAEEPERVDDRIQVQANDWPWWRGPTRDGRAADGQSPPLEFSESQHVRWVADVPGRGHGSPTVWGERVFLASADEDSGAQSVLCFNRGDGQLLWRTVVHASGAMWKNTKASAASSTPACDGKRVYINFPNSDALFTTALDLDGQQIWQTRISDYVVHQGYGASPALYQDLVIVSSDNKGGGALAALQRSSGEVAWRRERPAKPNYSSPTLVHSAGRDQIIMTGCDQVVSYDPLTGSTNWEVAGATTECVTSTVTDGNLVYTSGGYPKNHMSAVRADGTCQLAWENTSRLYVPSLVIKQGFLYGVLDEGIAMCWKADSGAVMWKSRLGGNFSSSLVIVDDNIMACSETGDVFVFQANSEEYVAVAKSHLGDQVFATPAICGSCIFHRVAWIDEAGARQEKLYCLSAD